MNAPLPRHHVLLVGIDAYPNPKVDPLYGCVNDVDALEAIFLDRLSVPPAAITKLVAPHTGSVRTSRVPEDKPTSNNFRRALEALAGDTVRPGDRVFFYYSGHGTQVFSRTACEALVPVDTVGRDELLYDYEINEILRRVAKRTEDLTVILDCCCSAGATRSTLATRGTGIRFCRIDDWDTDVPAPRQRSTEVSTGLFSSFDPSDPGFLVVASAQSGEAAHEGRETRGIRHGAFTAALLELLDSHSADKLDALRWTDVWQLLRARVTSAFPGQHPCLIGRSERRVFGGPFQRQDPGFPIRRVGDKYEIQAGTLVGVGVGAKVAVYGREPSFFPTLHSAADLAARLGLLRVESATSSSATALPVGNVFRIDEGTRGRLVEPGRADKLVVALEPFNADLARYLESEALVSVVPASGRADNEVEAVVGLSSDGCFWIGDEIFDNDAPLVRIPASDRVALVQGLLHYARYNLPSRLVRRCRDGVGALRMRVLDAGASSLLGPEELHDPPLPEAEPDPDRRYRYQITDGQPVCFSVENRSSARLYVNVINCSASGKVEILGPTQLEIAPKRRQTFWMRGHLGKPFPCRISAGRVSNVERLVVVGTTSPDVDLGYLRVSESFANAVATRYGERSAVDKEPSDWWTAASVTVKIVRP